MHNRRAVDLRKRKRRGRVKGPAPPTFGLVGASLQRRPWGLDPVSEDLLLIVEETLPGGRRRTLSARVVPAGGVGPVRFAAGLITGRAAAPAPRPAPDDDLCVLAVAVGVIS